MRVLNERSAGLDVHKKTVVACVMQTHQSGEVKAKIQTFATTTAGLLALSDWRAQVSGDAGRDGEYRSLLETSLQHFGGSL